MDHSKFPDRSPIAGIRLRLGGIATYRIDVPVRARKPLLFVAVAVFIALAVCLAWKPVPYAEQLLHVQAEQELGHIDKAILNEPLEVQGMLLDYARDKTLVLKAWIALSRYPDQARRILSLYGAEQEFKDILLAYGESVIPVIQYFRDNDIWTVKAGNVITTTNEAVKDFLRNLWQRATRDEVAAARPAAQAKPRQFGPDERGWYAVHIIKQEGHDFLGQFKVGKDDVARRNQVDRIVKVLTSFFTNGLRTIETKYNLGEDITASDAFWAGLDVALVAVPAKLLGAGKMVARSGEELNLATRTRLVAPRLVSKAKIFRKLGKYGAVAATVYIVVTHPSLINSVLADVARLIGFDPWLVQFAGWSLIIFLLLYPFSWLLKALARLVLVGFSSLERSRKNPRTKTRPAPPNPITV